MLDFALSFTPGGEAVKALYTSSTGRELGTGAWSQRSDGAVLLQGLVGAATLAPVFPAAGKAFGAIKAERQMLAHVRAEVTPRIFWTSGADLAKPAAQELAKRTGGLTIEMTTKGRLMNAITVGTPKPLRKVWNNTWDSLSKEFANGARGPVFIVHPSVRPISPRSTWMRIEKRELDSQGNKIIDHSF